MTAQGFRSAAPSILMKWVFGPLTPSNVSQLMFAMTAFVQPTRADFRTSARV